MINGDISNETPPRLIVVVDTVVSSEVEENKQLFRGAKLSRKVTTLNNAMLSSLWNKSFKFGLSVELAAFEDALWTEELLTGLMSRLDNRGANPFNYAEVYPNIEYFVSDLPYRPNLQGVVDLPERLLRYGSWGLDLDF
jgi:hypothetical protein